ncbi:MAG TPA: hypothetical protein VEU62_00650 [Bryobacterales bacterium]|nr:hypothetical protein [Bryobacterales bacterium]
MNCQDFEAIVDDLARDEMMEVSTRQDALAHAQACPPCAERLAGERALAADLRALAEADELEEAPLRLELPLVAAFRDQAAVSPASRMRPRPRWATHAALGAVAASVLLIAALTVMAVRRYGSPQRSGPRPAQQVRPVAPKPVLAKAVEPGPPLPAHARRTVTSSSIRAAQATAAEVATDFLPLPYGDALTTLEGSHLVRIRLSHSALTTFGLPVNQDRRGELIQADVLLGEDGLARAIRFVR